MYNKMSGLNFYGYVNFFCNIFLKTFIFYYYFDQVKIILL